MEISHNVPITGYVIQCIKDGTQDIIKDIKNISGTTHTISGLDACTKYSVKVAAMNVDGTGPFSEPVLEISGKDSELILYFILYKRIYICDRDCKNQPCERKLHQQVIFLLISMHYPILVSCRKSPLNSAVVIKILVQ